MTAIITPCGVYQFLACPFGLSTAPSEYQTPIAYVVLKAFYGLSFILMILFSTVCRNVEEFMGVLDRILSQLTKFNS